MKVKIGCEGLDLTWQDRFPKETDCDCGRKARIAFVAKEDGKHNEKFVCSLHSNKGKGGFWPHDCIAVAIYFCPDCFKAVALWNQG